MATFLRDRDQSVTATSGNGAVIVSLFGGCSVTNSDGQEIDLQSRKGRAVIAYLAATPGSSATRETLATLLWSNSPESSARTSLRQCVRQIRKAFDDAGISALKTTRDLVSLAPDLTVLDLTERRAELEIEPPAPILLDPGLHPMRLLEGFEDLDEGFTAWIRVLRQHWEDRYLRFLRRRLLCGEPKAAEAARLILAVDATHEEAHRALIRASAEAGNLAAALRQYETLWVLLDEDYDIEPDQETQELIAEIKAGEFRPPSTAVATVPAVIEAETVGPPATILPRSPVIGVWSFMRAGPWTQDGYLIEGFRRDLIAALVRFREWVVIEGGASLGEMTGAELPDYAVEGSFYEEGGDVHLVITLRDTVRSHYIWSERVELSLESWFSVRRQLVRKIAMSLNIYLSVDEMRKGLGSEDEARRVYARWLAAQELSARWRPQDELAAEREFRQLIREAPSFAPAYSSLVQIINARHHVFPGHRRSDAQHAEALELARRAVEHDPLDSRTQLCLAWSYAMSAMYPQAAMSYRLSYRLNDNDPWTLVSCALGLAYCDAIPEALELEAQAQQAGLDLSPLHWAYRAGVRFISGDFRGCVEAADLAEDATFYIGGWKASSLANLGDLDAARTEAERFTELVGAHWFGPEDPCPEAIAAWFLEAFPIRNRAVWGALRDGLRRAGLACPS